jgi:Flp pilus assembly protein TadG
VTATRLQTLVRTLRGRSRSGSAAIEFAFVAPVFFLFFFGIMEGGIMFFGKAALSNATQDAARLIRTGQAQNGGMNQGAFKTQICNGISVLLNCDNLTVDVQAYPSGFSAGGLGSPTNSSTGELNPNQNNYNTGQPCNVVVVRAFYRYSIITPIVAPLMSGNSGRTFNFLTAAAAFRNEPFNSTVAGC